MPKTCHPLPRTSILLYPKDASAPDWPMTMAGTITAQMVSSHSPGTMKSSSPIPIPIPARIDATATPADVWHRRRDSLAERQVHPAVPDVLHRFDQRGLHQEGGDDPDDGAEQSPEDTQQSGQGRGDHGRDDVDDEGDRQQVPREGPVELPRLAEYARKGIHSRNRTGPGQPAPVTKLRRSHISGVAGPGAGLGRPRLARIPAMSAKPFAATGAATTAAAVIGTAATDVDSRWYRGLELPRWQPPGQVIGQVWTVLYVLIAIATGRAWNRAEPGLATAAGHDPGHQPVPQRGVAVGVLPRTPASARMRGDRRPRSLHSGADQGGRPGRPESRDRLAALSRVEPLRPGP